MLLSVILLSADINLLVIIWFYNLYYNLFRNFFQLNSLSYKTQSVDLHCNTSDWFLCEGSYYRKKLWKRPQFKLFYSLYWFYIYAFVWKVYPLRHALGQLKLTSQIFVKFLSLSRYIYCSLSPINIWIINKEINVILLIHSIIAVVEF